MNKRDIIIGLDHIENIGWKTISKLINKFNNIDILLTKSYNELMDIGLKQKQIENIFNYFSKINIKDLINKYDSNAINIMTIFDEEYPFLLKKTSQPPWVIYYRGNSKLLNQPILAIVGTRSPTYYGKKVAEEYASILSNERFTIVSGLARGIDSHAHIGALRGAGKTISVLGTAIDLCYPPENRNLYQQIIQEGIVISEYPMGTKMHVGMFPQRNRILAGLSLGVIVVEAAAKSGSLFTADYALDENRDVFAIPGQITSFKSVGTNHLIKQGCKLVSSINDITEEYRHLFNHQAYIQDTQTNSNLTTEEQKILGLLQDEPVMFDNLSKLSGYQVGTLHETLFSLQIKKMIHQLPGYYYIKI